jgi:hypothetical protein
VTALVTICADGTVLQSTIIFKGQNFMQKWQQDCRRLHEYTPLMNDEGLSDLLHSFGHSPNGWTDGKLALEWMTKDFNAQTKEKAAGRTRILLMDRHSSHYTLPLLEFARASRIIILGYPPHCTHVLQGLDVVCFAKMKNEF